MTNILIIDLLFAHLIADFLLQKKSWIVERSVKHARSGGLWKHIGVHIAIMYLVLCLNLRYPLITCLLAPLIVAVFHAGIDIWKSYKGESLKYFLLDQVAHLATLIVVSALLDTGSLNWVQQKFHWLTGQKVYLRLSFYILATFPAGLVIARLTERWRAELPENESLANAGMWIGIMERLLIMIFISVGKFEAIGLLITAKSLLRFADKDSHSAKKTEYILIGTLLSFSITVILGLLAQKLA